jgi:hypothetical protein
MRQLFVSIVILMIVTPNLWTNVDAGPRSTTARKPAHSKPSKEPTTEPEVSLSPAVFLVRDPVIQAELKLSAAQKTAAGELAAEFNEPVWKLRDASSASADARDEIRRINETADARLKSILDAAQFERLDQMVLRVQGPPALLQPKTAERVGLTDRQREKIVALLAESKAALDSLRRDASSAKGVPDLNRKLDKLNSGVQRDILATLTSEQREGWNGLLGKPFDLSRLQPLTALGPELRDVVAWINAEPLTLAGLRGQVVALHFWTFG